MTVTDQRPVESGTVEPAPASGSAALRGRLGDGLAVLAAGLLALVASRPLSDNSFLTHLATGRLLLERGLPDTNPFLYTAVGDDFPVPSWWWSGVLAGVERVTDATGIRLLTALLAGLLGALLVRLTRPAPGEEDEGSPENLLAAVVPVAAAVLCLLPFLNPRPHLPGFLLLGVTLVLWCERRSPWWLVPVFATWVNVHGSWLYGLVVLGLLVVAEALDRRRVELTRFAYPAAAAAGCAIGGVLYPQRFRLIGLPFEQMGSERAREALSAYQEWAPLRLDEPYPWLLVALALVAVVGAVRRHRWGTATCALLLVALGWSSGRVMPIAAISLVPLAAAGLRDVGALRRPSGVPARVVGGVGVVLCLLATAHALGFPRWDLDRYPVAAVDYLESRGLMADPDVNVVSHDYVGNYLEYRYGSDAHAYADDRPGVDVLLDYAALNQLHDGWRRALERAEPDVVVWNGEKGLGDRLAADPAWVDVGTLEGFRILCRSELASRCLPG